MPLDKVFLASHLSPRSVTGAQSDRAAVRSAKVCVSHRLTGLSVLDVAAWKRLIGRGHLSDIKPDAYWIIDTNTFERLERLPC